jgi:hypothetical protein
VVGLRRKAAAFLRRVGAALAAAQAPAEGGRKSRPCTVWEIKRGRKNPTQHRYHITNPFSSQRLNGPLGAKSVFSTKANVCIWETFRLEKLEIPCYLIVTKRNRKNTESSGGLPKANGKYGNQSDFKSK